MVEESGVENSGVAEKSVGGAVVESQFWYYLTRWTLVCLVCAAPSFVLALTEKEPFDPIAMLAGVGVFVVIYTVFCCSKWYVKIKRLPTIYKALRWSYTLKIVLAILAVPFAFSGVNRAGDMGMIFMFPDFISGLYAIMFYLAVTRGSENLHASEKINYDFFDTLAITLIEGVLLSAIILVFAVSLMVALKILQKTMCLIRKEAET